MEDYILREIDKIGQMLVLISKKLGLFDNQIPSYTLAEVKGEFCDAGLPFDPDVVLQMENPLLHLVEELKLSDEGLETFMEIVFYSDLCESRKSTLLKDAITYMSGKGKFSFRLHSLSSR